VDEDKGDMDSESDNEDSSGTDRPTDSLTPVRFVQVKDTNLLNNMLVKKYKVMDSGAGASSIPVDVLPVSQPSPAAGLAPATPQPLPTAAAVELDAPMMGTPAPTNGQVAPHGLPASTPANSDGMATASVVETPKKRAERST
jgi:hypothetical protein